MKHICRYIRMKIKNTKEKDNIINEAGGIKGKKININVCQKFFLSLMGVIRQSNNIFKDIHFRIVC